MIDYLESLGARDLIALGVLGVLFFADKVGQI